jgi:hypothetical protein
VTLTTSSVCQLAGQGVFNNTLIQNENGKILVPVELWKKYKTATHWVEFADKIFPTTEGIFNIEKIKAPINSTKTVEINNCYFSKEPQASITSSSNAITISNIEATNDLITFDITAKEILTEVNCQL